MMFNRVEHELHPVVSVERRVLTVCSKSLRRLLHDQNYVAVERRRLMERNNNRPTLFYAYYFVVFFGTAIQSSFLMMYLSHAGMSSSLIGLVNGLTYLISFIVYPIYGAVADRASNKNKVLIVGMILSIVLLIVFSQVQTLFGLGLIMTLFTTVHNPLIGIYESITMQHSLSNKWNYGRIRMSGTLGYAAMALMSGYGLSKNESLIFPFYIISMILATVLACFLPQTSKTLPQSDSHRQHGGNIYSMLKVKKIRNVMILYSLFTLGTAFKQTYYGIYMNQLGGTYDLVGIANMFMALSEIPFYLGPGKRWMKRIGIEKCMLFITAVGVLRWLLVGISRTPTLLVITMLFNGMMLVPTVVGVVEFLHENAPEHLKVSAQTALRAPFLIGGQLLGTVVGGWFVGVLDAAGLPGIRIGFTAMAPLHLILLIFVGRSMRKDQRQNEIRV